MPEKGNLNEDNQDTYSSISSLSSIAAYSPVLTTSQPSISSDSSSEGHQYLYRPQYPVQPNLALLNLPQEPSLQDLLRELTGQDNLDEVVSIQIRISSHRISLQRIPIFTPNLQSLNIEGSNLTSLRDLGCLFEQLKFLNASNCGLMNLDGLDMVKSLETLIANNNRIENIFPCSSLALLKRLCLRNNRITDVATLSFLGMCPLLSEVDLKGNVVTGRATYWSNVKKFVRNLKILDDASYSDSETENGNELSTNENISSLTDDAPLGSYNSNGGKIKLIPLRDVPGCSKALADTSEIHLGSLINQNRRKHFQETQKSEDLQNSSSSSSNCSSRNLRSSDGRLEFPPQMAHARIKLEPISSMSLGGQNACATSTESLVQKFKNESNGHRDMDD